MGGVDRRCADGRQPVVRVAVADEIDDVGGDAGAETGELLQPSSSPDPRDHFARPGRHRDVAGGVRRQGQRGTSRARRHADQVVLPRRDRSREDDDLIRHAQVAGAGRTPVLDRPGRQILRGCAFVVQLDEVRVVQRVRVAAGAVDLRDAHLRSRNFVARGAVRGTHRRRGVRYEITTRDDADAGEQREDGNEELRTHDGFLEKTGGRTLESGETGASPRTGRAGAVRWVVPRVVPERGEAGLLAGLATKEPR